MSFIARTDIIPIILSTILFYLMAILHRVILPLNYSSFLLFFDEVDDRKVIVSNTLRLLYTIFGTIILFTLLGYTDKQICIGIFLTYFLNIWPSIMQNKLLSFNNSIEEWIALFSYCYFICSFVIVCFMTIHILIPIIKGDTKLYWLDNQGISFLVTLISMLFSIDINALFAKFSRIRYRKKIDTFYEDIKILERKINLDNYRIHNNRYAIERASLENDINYELIKTIISLELFYRGSYLTSVLEKLSCNIFKQFAIYKNITVGIAQIKISTAADLLCKDPQNFISELCHDDYNIKVLGMLLKSIIASYEEQDDDFKHEIDIYYYIACKYLGTSCHLSNKTTLVYSAVLRSCCNGKIYYTGSYNYERYNRTLVCMFSEMFFARPFWRKLQNIFGECCISKLAKVAKPLDSQLLVSQTL